jgi:hypothetical protein
MRLYYDRGIEKFVQAPGNRSEVTALIFKRGNSSSIDLSFCQDGAIVELAVGATGVLQFKPLGDYGGEDPVVSDSDWTKSGTGTSTIYTFTPSFNTTQLNELLVDGTVTGYVADSTARYALTGLPNGTIYGQSNDGSYWKVIDHTALSTSAGWTHAPQKSTIPLIAEIAWVESGRDGSGPVLSITVNNDLIKGTEGVPTDAVPSYPPPDALHSHPTWLANGSDDAGSFYPEGDGGSIDGTTDFYINDTAASGGTGWNGYFLTRIGSAPWTLNLTDSLGRVTTFSVASIDDNGGGYVHLAVTFRNGFQGDWFGNYQFDISSVATAPVPTPFACGNISGSYAPDLANGRYQYIYQLTGNLTINEPLFNEGTYRQLGESLLFEIQWAGSAYTLDFSADIKMPDAARAALPVTLEAYKSYLIELRVIGGYWWLKSITGPTPERVD